MGETRGEGLNAVAAHFPVLAGGLTTSFAAGSFDIRGLLLGGPVEYACLAYSPFVVEAVPVDRGLSDVPRGPGSVECGMVGTNVGVAAHGWEVRNR